MATRTIKPFSVGQPVVFKDGQRGKIAEVYRTHGVGDLVCYRFVSETGADFTAGHSELVLAICSAGHVRAPLDPFCIHCGADMREPASEAESRRRSAVRGVLS